MEGFSDRIAPAIGAAEAPKLVFSSLVFSYSSLDFFFFQYKNNTPAATKTTARMIPTARPVFAPEDMPVLVMLDEAAAVELGVASASTD